MNTGAPKVHPLPKAKGESSEFTTRPRFDDADVEQAVGQARVRGEQGTTPGGPTVADGEDQKGRRQLVTRCDELRRGRLEIDQLARAIQELDQLTQSNASMVGAWTGAASELRGESQRLAGLVTRFKLPQQQSVTPDREPPIVTRDEAPTRSSPAPSRRQLPR